MAEYKYPPLPSLGGGSKRAQKLKPKLPKLELKTRAAERATRPLRTLSGKEKSLIRSSLMKRASASTAKTLATKIGSRLVPALAVASAVNDLARMTNEGINAYMAKKDLEMTRAYVQNKYGTPERAAATRRKMHRR